MDRETLTAPEGKIYKRGADYGFQVHVGVNEDPNEWVLVDEAEYFAFLAAQQDQEVSE